ncbi:uncharacterized protein [Miscanthus floridulus]|uniref:uncharacterized protein n=1 Tax=Miscanthus floridulus TaxID=154761 RepID=UPI0034588DD1
MAISFDEWRPSIEGTIDDIRFQVKKLSLGWERACVESPGDKFGVFAPSPSVVQRPAADSQPPVIGPRVEHQNRESGFGVVSTLIHSPVKGEHPISQPHLPVSNVQSSGAHVSNSSPVSHESHGNPNSKIPKVDFPKFDGDQPKLWLSDCLDYFSLYHVESSSWVRIARLHFVAAAKRWYNADESQIQGCSWETISALVMARFGKDHYELLLRQLFQIRQSSTVAEYIEQFSAIVDQLGAYHRTIDPLFFTMRFIDGLKDHIRAPVSLHRPLNWDTACVLAQLQEDLLAPRKLEVRKWDVSTGTKLFARVALPLHSPPPRSDKPVVNGEFKNGTEAGRSLTADERWAALRSSRRSQGLCICCGLKWSRDHCCAQLAAMD